MAEKTQGWVTLIIVIIVIKDVYVQYLIRSVSRGTSCIDTIQLGWFSNKDYVLVWKLNCWSLTEFIQIPVYSSKSLIIRMTKTLIKKCQEVIEWENVKEMSQKLDWQKKQTSRDLYKTSVVDCWPHCKSLTRHLICCVCIYICLFVWSANPYLSWFSSHMSLWSSITFQFAVLLNFLVAFFYPFNEVKKGKCFTLKKQNKNKKPWRFLVIINTHDS